MVLHMLDALIYVRGFFSGGECSLPVQARGSAASSGLFLLDNTRISQLSLATGKTRRNFPTLASVQSELVRTCTSHSGSVLAGLTLQGHLFVWLQPSRHLTIYTTPLSAPPSIPPSAPSLLPEHLKGNCELQIELHLYCAPYMCMYMYMFLNER